MSPRGVFGGGFPRQLLVGQLHLVQVALKLSHPLVVHGPLLLVRVPLIIEPRNIAVPNLRLISSASIDNG
jgi:hypothetical protein